MSFSIKRGRLLAAAVVSVAVLLAANSAGAWGAAGHRLIGYVAVKTLPDDLPGFVRRAASDVGELAREPDRTKGSGKLHDEYREGNHFVDIDDQGRTGIGTGGPSIDALPPTRQLYDDALRANGATLSKAGWLPYSIADAYADLQTDFGLWRIARVGERKGRTAAHRAWFKHDRERREALILADMGELAHFVGDGSQPLHTSIHYNGWGESFPNPHGYTNEKIHNLFEGVFVYRYIRAEDIIPAMGQYAPCEGDRLACIAAYLKASWSLTERLYQLEQTGAFRGDDPNGKAFVVDRLAAGATQLRNLYVEAWRSSATAEVGWPKVKVSDVEAQGLDVYENLYGKD
ncbi:MAG: S1/P1 Nuclease [Caulobacteraceae bacterium]|nr:S1/P1 Nuclease [Caulobacteraceae bacterium]